jgi:hypothetical protein
MSIESEVRTFANKTAAGNLTCTTTILNGREIPSTPTYWLGGFRRKDILDVIAHADHGASSLTKFTFEAYIPGFMSAFATDHRSIITDRGWLNFYHASAHPVPWQSVDRDGNAAPHIYRTGIPCWGCGLFLPIQAIQIDHSRPQAGEPMEAVAKYFRHKGLTVGGPKGVKGQATLGGTTPAPQTVNERYTLNALGRMIYQLIVSAGAKDLLMKVSMNSYANLRPMCAQCNIGRNAGPQNKF